MLETCFTVPPAAALIYCTVMHKIMIEYIRLDCTGLVWTEFIAAVVISTISIPKALTTAIPVIIYYILR